MQFMRIGPTFRHRIASWALGSVGVLVLACESSPDDGGECVTNEDCRSSPRAEENRRQCQQDIYCLEGTCYWECRETCVVARTDVNPCEPPRLCAKIYGSVSTDTYCTMEPVLCHTAADCPLYLPTDGGSWSCNAGQCDYPGHAYATQ